MVRWSNVVRTSGCFFFSGPAGRDDQLVGDVVIETVERDGEQIRMRIGTATFAGTYANGTLQLKRTSKYDYGGPWTTTETIIGQAKDDQPLVARYTYHECEVASKKCPGQCTITGDLAFSKHP